MKAFSRRKKRYAVIGAALALGSGAAMTAPGCRSATQITVDIRTLGMTCADLKGVSIVVAGSRDDAENKLDGDTLSAQIPRGECGADDHRLGTLVVTPGSSHAAIIVRARVSEGPDSPCKRPEYTGCIIARRAFSFVDHTSETLPITLEASCTNKPCDPTTSCRTGTCVDSSANCSEGADTCESLAEPMVSPNGMVILPDGAAAPTDGSVATDGSVVDGSDGATTRDTGVDAPIDALVEAGTDYGNACPIPGGSTDCHESVGPSSPCCRMSGLASYYCGGTNGMCMMLDDHFLCTGRKACAEAQFCCASAALMMPKSSTCLATNFCAAESNTYLCNGMDDCPPDQPYCSGTYLVGEPLRKCSATP
jgi:hypothetical protein